MEGINCTLYMNKQCIRARITTKGLIGFYVAYPGEVEGRSEKIIERPGMPGYMLVPDDDLEIIEEFRQSPDGTIHTIEHLVSDYTWRNLDLRCPECGSIYYRQANFQAEWECEECNHVFLYFYD